MFCDGARQAEWAPVCQAADDAAGVEDLEAGDAGDSAGWVSW